MTILASEIDKVVICSGDHEGISGEDLAVSVPGGVEVVFSLLDAVGDINPRLASDIRDELAVPEQRRDTLGYQAVIIYQQDVGLDL